MMNSVVKFKLPTIVCSLFFLFVCKGVWAQSIEVSAPEEKKETTKKDAPKSKSKKSGMAKVIKGSVRSKPVKGEKKGKSKIVKTSEQSAPTQAQDGKSAKKSVSKKKTVVKRSSKSKVLRDAKKIRALAKFDRNGSIKSYRQAVEKLTAFIEKDFGRSGISFKIRKQEELDLFRGILSICTVAGYTKFDTAEHFDTALKLLNTVLDSNNKAKFKSKSIIKRIEKLQKRVEEEKKNPKKLEERKKKAEQVRSAKKSKSKIRIKATGMKKSKNQITSKSVKKSKPIKSVKESKPVKSVKKSKSKVKEKQEQKVEKQQETKQEAPKA